MAYEEYERLDHSIAKIVDKKLGDLEKRAEDVGKPLSGNLSGYREIKLREAGIRIIYEASKEESTHRGIVHILTIQKRDKDQVFESAAQRTKAGK